MKKILFVLWTMFFVTVALTQSVTQRLIKAFDQLEKDPQLRAAIASLYVADAKTGKVVFERNSGIGLAPASTLKLITSIAAYELLGKEFRYQTEFGISEKDSAIYIFPSGDPTLGSWRWEETKEKNTLARITASIKKNRGSFHQIIIKIGRWNAEAIPDGWIWQDIGNYYGAGTSALNWRENQFDVLLKSGKQIGDAVTIVRTEPELYSYKLSSRAVAAAKGTGDNAYIYFPLNQSEGIVRGTIPLGENSFSISGALPSPQNEFAELLIHQIKDLQKKPAYLSTLFTDDSEKDGVRIIHTEISPPLDSIIYWLNKKSINLYAEALVKTIAYKEKSIAATNKGIEIIKDFYKTKGINPVELNMADGSGLSPLNRVTTRAQVQALLYAKKQPWFNSLYHSLPVYNGMKMKSGTINDVKGFTGFHTSASGTEYAFAFLVNNYNESSAGMVKKMYEVLNELK